MSSKIIMPDGSTRHMGRKRSVAKAPRLSLKSYLAGGAGVALPPPPAAVDYSHAAASALSQMYLNDQLGDCVAPRTPTTATPSSAQATTPRA